MNTSPLPLSEKPITSQENIPPIVLSFSDQLPTFKKTPSPKKLFRSESSKSVERVRGITRIHSEKTTNVRRQSQYTMGKRMENINELRKIDECLKEIFSFQNRKIILTEDSSIDVMNRDNKLEEIMSAKVIEHIYLRIIRAMTHQIYYFFDDKGFPVTLKELDKMVRVKYGEINQDYVREVKKDLSDYYMDKPLFLFGNEINNEYEYVEHIEKLPFPKKFDVEDIPKNEKTCISILQRLYQKTAVNEENGKTPVMSPITFLCSYKKFVTTEQLFTQILRVIQLQENEMPLLQKMRALNLLRVFLSSQLHMDEKITKNHKNIIHKIITFGIGQDVQEIVDIAFEINQLIEKKETYFLLEAGTDSFEPQYEVSKFLSEQIKKNGNNLKFLNFVVNDLKYLAAQSVVNISSGDLYQEKLVNDSETYYNQLVNYVVVLFMNIFNKELEGLIDQKHLKKKLNRFFEFFINVASELNLKHDYLSSVAIYSALNISSISNLLFFKEPQKTNKSLSKGRRSSLIKSTPTINQLHELQQFFSTNKNFETLRNKMKDCQATNVFYVPFLGPIKNINLHKLELIQNSHTEDNVEINNVELSEIALKVWEDNTMLQGIRKQFKKDQQFSKHTDIGYDLMTNEAYNEDQLDQIYKRIKLILS